MISIMTQSISDSMAENIAPGSEQHRVRHFPTHHTRIFLLKYSSSWHIITQSQFDSTWAEKGKEAPCSTVHRIVADYPPKTPHPREPTLWGEAIVSHAIYLQYINYSRGRGSGGGANRKCTTTTRAKRWSSHILSIHTVTTCFRACILAVLC